MRQRVLVVDDDADIRDCVRMILEDEGFAVEEAPGGEAALRVLRGNPPDLIILDFKMPGMNAEEFLTRARGDAILRCPVILVTADRDPSELAQRVRTDGVLEKPFSLDELLSAVRRHLPGARAGA